MEKNFNYDSDPDFKAMEGLPSGVYLNDTNLFDLEKKETELNLAKITLSERDYAGKTMIERREREINAIKALYKKRKEENQQYSNYCKDREVAIKKAKEKYEGLLKYDFLFTLELCNLMDGIELYKIIQLGSKLLNQELEDTMNTIQELISLKCISVNRGKVIVNFTIDNDFTIIPKFFDKRFFKEQKNSPIFVDLKFYLNYIKPPFCVYSIGNKVKPYFDDYFEEISLPQYRNNKDYEKAYSDFNERNRILTCFRGNWVKMLEELVEKGLLKRKVYGTVPLYYFPTLLEVKKNG